MCEIKTVLVYVCLILLVTASFCIYRVYPEKKVGQHSETEIQNPSENEYEDYFWMARAFICWQRMLQVVTVRVYVE